jgi:hypothetical protein
VDRTEQDTLPSAIVYAIGIKGVLGAGTASSRGVAA